MPNVNLRPAHEAITIIVDTAEAGAPDGAAAVPVVGALQSNVVLIGARQANILIGLAPTFFMGYADCLAILAVAAARFLLIDTGATPRSVSSQRSPTWRKPNALASTWFLPLRRQRLRRYLRSRASPSLTISVSIPPLRAAPSAGRQVKASVLRAMMSMICLSLFPPRTREWRRARGLRITQATVNAGTLPFREMNAG